MRKEEGVGQLFLQRWICPSGAWTGKSSVAARVEPVSVNYLALLLDHAPLTLAKAYTAYEFRDFYVDARGEQGWVDEWVTAKPEQRQAKDGTWYTWEEFVVHYGDKAAWSAWASAKIAGKSDEL